MNLNNALRSIALLATLAMHLLPAAQAASHQEAPLTAYHDVEFEGRGFEYDAAGNLVSVARVDFSATTVDGRTLEGSGALSLPAQSPGDDAAARGIIDDILGRGDSVALGQMPPFTGWAVAVFDSIDIADDRFRATGELRLQAEFLEPAADVLNVRIGWAQTADTHRPNDTAIYGLAEVRFSGVGQRDGVDVTVSGTAEFRFQGDTAEGVDWFMAFGEWKIYAAQLVDAATGGALLFEELSGSIGQARIVGTIDPSGQIDFTDGLGQVTLER